MTRTLSWPMFVAFFLLTFVACAPQEEETFGAIEEGAEEMGEGMEETGDAMEEGEEEIDEGMEEGADEMEEAGEAMEEGWEEPGYVMDDGMGEEGATAARTEPRMNGGDATLLIAARDLLARNEPAPPDLGGYGYLTFTERPQIDDPARHLATCEAFFGTLEPTENLPASVAPRERMVTFWLLENPLADAVGDDPICADLLERYDYPRAVVIATEVGKAGVEGPLLVAWTEPFEEARGREEALVLDLSLFSDQDLQRAIRIWKHQVSRQPEHWEDGFKMVQFRETFRNLLERYGDGILTLLRQGA